jgi:hypothetical protein
MKKISLLLVIGLLCISLSSLAGEVITNDTGEDATGLRVVFSAPVKITAFGDILTDVDPEGTATEFVFSGGTVTAWGSHWLSWTPSSATIVSHEWLRGSLTSKTHTGSPLVLPTTTTTRFPLLDQDTDAVGLPALEFSSSLLSEYKANDSMRFQVIDGFSPGSTVPLERWYSRSVDDGIHTYSNLTPPPGSPVQYAYPDDGNTGYLALQYQEPIDLSSFEGLRIVASADHPVEIEIVVGTCADEIPMDEDSPCGEGAARFSMLLSVTTEPQVFVLPFSQFEVHPYILQQYPTASTEPQFHGVFDMIFRPDDGSGTLEIHQVSAVRQEIVVEQVTPVINEYYFQHPAYVMQGVNELESIYALPLEGIPELGTSYAAIDPNSEELTWTVETSNPEIGAGFQDEILYIWGADADWSGYGSVALTVTDPESLTDSAVIPVIVFDSNRILVDASGNNQYFVPWSLQLDINRIVSVEEHMREYDRPDYGLLDRSLRFSGWRVVEPIEEMILVGWLNTNTSGLSQQTIFERVNETYAELRRIGCNAINIWRFYVMETPTASCPTEQFQNWLGLSMTEREIRYAIDEAHLQGLYVILSPHVAEALGTMRAFDPPDVERWFECYADLVLENSALAQGASVDAFTVANILSAGTFWGQGWSMRTSKWMNVMWDILNNQVRPFYHGPVVYMPGSLDIEGQEQISILPFLHDVDIVGIDSAFKGSEITTSLDPSIEEVEAVIDFKLRQLVEPLYESLRKPMYVNETSMQSFDGSIRAWDMTGSVPAGATYDGAEQALWFEAWFRAKEKFPYILSYGLFPWGFVYGTGGVGELGLTPRMKPAEAVIAREYGVTTYAPIIILDGVLEDWNLVSDRVSATHRTATGASIAISDFLATKDDAYAYVAIRLSDEALEHHIINIMLDTDLDMSPDMPLGIFAVQPITEDPHRNWMATLMNAPMKWDEVVGCIDIRVNRASTVFELRIPLSMLPIESTLNLQAELLDTTRRKIKMLDRTSWLPLVPG